MTPAHSCNATQRTPRKQRETGGVGHHRWLGGERARVSLGSMGAGPSERREGETTARARMHIRTRMRACKRMEKGKRAGPVAIAYGSRRAYRTKKRVSGQRQSRSGRTETHCRDGSRRETRIAAACVCVPLSFHSIIRSYRAARV